jgi:DNA repair protein RecN (Recombination protein N)
MLALKTVLAEADSVPVLVFDEIDMNIGGETAVTVGNELCKLAETHQVLCISHLPQVASQAERHYLVEKAVKNGRTSTDVTILSSQKRTEEIARMLGGGKAARSHAKSLLSSKKD